MKNIFTPVVSVIFLLLFATGVSVQAQTTEDFKKEQFLHQEDTLNYRILYPKDFSEDKKYPLVLFLHGAGERGKDNEMQLANGSRLFLENMDIFPAIVVFPQAPAEDFWAKIEVERDSLPYDFNFYPKQDPTTALSMVMKLMDSITSAESVDNSRVYVGGLSMGGMGTFEILSRKPEMFAAAFAICGGGDPEIAKDYPEGFNIWIFHGEQDEVVLPKYSKSMARAVNSAGGNAKLSLYPEDDHNSWDTAFAEPYLLEWLFSHSNGK